VNVAYEAPIKPENLVGMDGAFESVSLGGATGSFDNVLACADGLRFDEQYEQDIIIQVVRFDTTGVGAGAQQLVEERAQEILFEVLGEISDQSNWDKTALDLDQFSYVMLIPLTQIWEPGYLGGTTGGRGVTCRLGIEISARRAYT
jgi:hypothetical protein